MLGRTAASYRIIERIGHRVSDRTSDWISGCCSTREGPGFGVKLDVGVGVASDPQSVTSDLRLRVRKSTLARNFESKHLVHGVYPTSVASRPRATAPDNMPHAA